MSEPDRGPRSLDAIHLATARILAPELDALVSYDDRLIKAAAEADLATLFPGTEGRQMMLTIDARALLTPPRPFTDDELTDLIAAVVDDLDARVIDPSVSTYRSDSGTEVEVSMIIDTDNPWVAQATAAAAIRDAFDAAVPAVAGMTRGLVLQGA